MSTEDCIKSYLKSEKNQSRNVNQLILAFLEMQAKEDDNEINKRLFKNLILQYSDAERKLVELNQLKNKFLGIASHDLRNPISSIKGFSEILLNEEEDDMGTLTKKQREIVTTINRISKDLLSLLNNLLDISVIESGNLRINIKECSINSLLRERLKINRVIAEKKSITIKENMESMPNALFDPERISQVIDNLISNAIKFSPLGSTIYVTLLTKNGKAQIKIKDEGPGIQKEDQDKLFDEFQKIGTKTTGGEKSTGLGLSIAKKIIDAHSGKIKVSSKPGHGSEFMFTLPLSRTFNINEQKVIRILAADNLQDVITLLKNYLKPPGFEIDAAENGKIACDKAMKEDYDIIFMDIKMPVMDGNTATREIRKWEKETGKSATPIIALTSLDFINDIKRCLAAGCNDHITKPIDKDVLVNKILEYTKKREPVDPEESELDYKDLSLTLLYVEDDIDNQQLIKSYLNKTNCKYEVAENGKIAFDKFVSSKYDLVLMDVEMPVMDGYTAREEMRKWERDNNFVPTPIIMLTAHEINIDDKEDIDKKYDGFITKPIKKSLLFETMKSFCPLKSG